MEQLDQRLMESELQIKESLSAKVTERERKKERVYSVQRVDKREKRARQRKIERREDNRQSLRDKREEREGEREDKREE